MSRDNTTTPSKTVNVVRCAAALIVAALVAAAVGTIERVDERAFANSAGAIDSGAAANRQAVRTDLGDRLGRPKVYLAYYGSEGLLGNTDSQWSYVRANLDGLWGNPFSLAGGFDNSLNNTIALTRKVATRDLIVEHPIVAGGRCIGFNDDYYFTEVERRARDISFERDGSAIYAGENPNCWNNVGGIDAARQFYGNLGYGNIYALFQPQNISNQLNASLFPTIVRGSTADFAYRTSDGVVVECPTDACTNPTFGAPFLDAMRTTHARGANFTWFTGYSRSYGIGSRGWLQAIQRTYRSITDNVGWREGDAIVVINYDGYRALPERNSNGTPADTTTGIVAWLLEQRPIPIGRR